jgi:DNA-binding SARP family transcriptional activator/Tfp pilus assembly protein PilF
VDFRVLGALEVWDGPRQIKLSGRHHPKLLAGLLLNSGRAVSISWLVDLLWDYDPPSTAERQVQNAMAALRRFLLSLRADVIEREGQLYRIVIEQDDLDLRRFEARIQQARDDAARHEELSAIDQYEDALALWRGPLLHGLGGKTLEPASRRVEDLYLSTFEEFAEVTLELGDPERIVERLRDLVDAHPRRQRLTARLMRTLFQLGRGAEALTIFHNLRSVLTDELGIDPSPELNDMKIRILTEDAALFPRSERIANQTSSVMAMPLPSQLPADIGTFTGRGAQLAALDQLHDSGARAGIVSAIAGIGGVGKTALAVHWGRLRRSTYPDGQLYINLRGFDEREPITPFDAISRLLRSMGVSTAEIPSQLDQASTLFRHLLADKRMLVLLDNAHNSEQVRPLLPESAGCLALITSRNHLKDLVSTHDALSVDLDVLSPKEALELLEQLLGSAALEEVDAANRLAELCGHLPLAIRVAAANLAQRSGVTLAQLGNEIDDESRLSHLRIAGDRSTDLSAVFGLSFRALDENAQRVFVSLGLIPGDDFTCGLGAAVSGLSAVSVASVFQQLESAHLLQQPQSGRFKLHDLVRLYARRLASSELTEAFRTKATDCLIDWYSDPSNVSIAEFENTIAACETLSSHPRLATLTRQFAWYASTGQDLRVLRDHAEIANKSAKKHGDVAGQARTLNALAAIHASTGNLDSAVRHFTDATDLLTDDKHRELKGRIMGNLGTASHARGAHDAAERYLRRAIAITEEFDDQPLLAIQLGSLGYTYSAVGKFNEAQDCLSRAFEISAADSAMKTVLLNHFGHLYLEMGRYADSVAASQHAIDIAVQIGATKSIAMAHNILGQVAQVQGRTHEAFEHYRQSSSIAQLEGRGQLHVEIFHHEADLYLDLGDVDRAVERLTTAKELFDSIQRSGVDVGGRERILSRVESARKKYSEAVSHAQRACSYYRSERTSPLHLARSLEALGDAHLGLNDHTEATRCHTEALEIFTRLDVPEAPKLRAKLQNLATP